MVSLRRGSVDRVSVTADPTRPGVAYTVWQSEGSVPSQSGTMFSKTTDGGKTWSIPVPIVPTQIGSRSTSGNVIVVDSRNDTLYDVFDLSRRLTQPRRVCGTVAGRHRCHTFSSGTGVPAFGDDVSFVRSIDGGATWSAPHTIAQDLSVGWVAPSFGSQVRTGATLPKPAVDARNGDLYVVWQDSRFSVGQLDDIALASSKDGGLHWAAPVRVDTPGPASAILPSVAVNSAGVVGVGYYQIRGASKGAPLRTDYWFRSSKDGGAHFGSAHHVAGPFDLRTAPTTFGYFIGDYQGLAAAGKSFHPFFVATNSGNKRNRTDVFTTTITP